MLGLQIAAVIWALGYGVFMTIHVRNPKAAPLGQWLFVAFVLMFWPLVVAAYAADKGKGWE